MEKPENVKPGRIKKRTLEIIDLLDTYYPVQEKCYLDYEEPWQLLVATILSAQATDAQVNETTPSLFKECPNPEAIANAPIGKLEKLVYKTGFYRNKARNIKGCMQSLVEKFNGVVPSDIDDLTSMPGVGRKTANVVRGNIYNLPSVVVDTHVKRISNRLGVTENQDPVKIEYDLMKALPKEHWIAWNTQIIAFGRDCCKAQHPLCELCHFTKYCKYIKENRS